MERDLAGNLGKPVLQKPETLKRVNGMHRSLERQVHIKPFKQLDRLLDEKIKLLRCKLVDRREKIPKAFAAGEGRLDAIVRGGDEIVQASAVGRRDTGHGRPLINS